MVQKNTPESQEAFVGLIHAIRQCIETNTKFAQSAETLLRGALPSATSTRNKKKERLSVRELEEILPLSAARIRRLAKTGEIPSGQLGKQLVFDLQAVLKAIDEPSAATKKREYRRDKGQTTKNDKDVTI